METEKKILSEEQSEEERAVQAHPTISPAILTAQLPQGNQKPTELVLHIICRTIIDFF